MARISCRDHGGTFERPVRRGRPPVRCNDNNQCSKHPAVKEIHTGPVTRAVKSRAADTASVIKNRRSTKAERRERIRSTPLAAETLPSSLRAPAKATQSPVEPSRPADPGIGKAMAAKDLLSAQGWVCHAKIVGDSIEFHAARGTERIAMLIRGGVIVSQDYTLWDTERPSTNEMPTGARKLPFNPDELTDAELASMLKERKVIWWNRISGKEEEAVCPAKLKIEHVFNGANDPQPADRLITFIDMDGGGFRTFRQGALMRLDK